MSKVAFDESSRPVATVDPEPVTDADNERRALIEQVRVETVRKTRAYLQVEFSWALRGRTLRTRMLRMALLKRDADDTTLAKRFHLSRQAVSKQRHMLVRLRGRAFIE